ncbi:MAG: DUF1501 domain-containing protein [Acidobacteria bacterium]|nr:DUF1501 domain-containing protein [Acidobacteriota bacterium]
MLNRRQLSRRDMLLGTSTGFGLTAFAGLAAESPARKPHFEPKIKSVIFCFMSGGVSHVDSFDPKPRLARDAGKPMPMPVKPTMFNDVKGIMPSPWSFKNYGQCGMPVSELFPHMGSRADDLCLIRSMTSTANEHAQGNFVIHTGQPFLGFPNAGAWINYGLGSENRNLPGFVVLASGGVPLGGIGMYGSGFLPAEHQASLLYPEALEALSNIRPNEEDREQQRRLAFISSMDRQFMGHAGGGDPQIETAIRNYETAYRMQTAVPELMELSGESEATKRLYGMDSPNANTAAYGKQCLLARRLVERGVRFIELTCLMRPSDPGQIGNPWDQHTALKEGHAEMALQVDQPIAGLVADLKARGLLDQTLVIWAGEFGRTPFAQGANGRDHNPSGFSIWLAGGGVKRGFTYGQTDEFGYYAVENNMTVYDLWATVLHLLGVDHERLTYRFGGRDYRLSDVHGRVIRDLLA